jgi:ABC-type nickel/cobalt efflux system permease component RcnA
MVILGMLLLIVAVIAAIAAVARGNVSVHIDLGRLTLDTNAGVVFFIGAAAMLVFLLGWWMLVRGMRRGHERRREVKALRQRAEASEATARREHEARVTERRHIHDDSADARHREHHEDGEDGAPELSQTSTRDS